MAVSDKFNWDIKASSGINRTEDHDATIRWNFRTLSHNAEERYNDFRTSVMQKEALVEAERVLKIRSDSAAGMEDFISRCLHDLEQDAHEEAIEIRKEVRDEAERILRQFRNLPDDTEVYAEDGGVVAIAVNRNPHGGFLLHCEPGGEALCVVVVEGISRRARYRDSSILPDGFLREGLRDVLRKPIA